ncbi:MAG: hypothetical protein LBS30_07290, partial [Planctomycetota bacterium]|nr:hypothetical protein [Planctomycetota bacterium]
MRRSLFFSLILILLTGAMPAQAARSTHTPPVFEGDKDTDGSGQKDQGQEDQGRKDRTQEEQDQKEQEKKTPPEQEALIEQASDVGDWGAPIASDTRKWTILVYLDGDNNLEGEALGDLIEMQRGKAKLRDPDAVEVIVLFDRAKGNDDSFGDWEETRVYRVLPSGRDDDIEADLLRNCGELNMSSPQTLENFITEGMRVFPAPRTALILWNHGSGWTGLLSDDTAPGAENDSDVMS